MKYVEKSNAKQSIIGTDNSIVQHLQFEYPDKEFYPLSKHCVCKDMRLTTLVDVLNCIKGTAGEEITLTDETMKKARICINRMLDYSK